MKLHTISTCLQTKTWFLGVEQAPDLNLTWGIEVCHTHPRTKGLEMGTRAD